MSEQKREIPVLISLAALASYNGMTDDPVQMMVSGTLVPGEDVYELTYTERMEDEESGEITESSIRMELRKDQVTMYRAGDFSNTMLFRKNRRFETSYHTPFGDLPMAVYAREVRVERGEDAGTIHLRYEVEMQGAYASTNELHLEYWAQDQE